MARVTLTTAVPTLPVREVRAAAEFYADRLGLAPAHLEDGFAVLRRDAVELHLWQAGDRSWQALVDFQERPVRSGAESFLAGTGSCRLGTGTPAELEQLYAACRNAGVLHPVSVPGIETTTYGVRQFHVLDLDGNLVTFFTHSS